MRSLACISLIHSESPLHYTLFWWLCLHFCELRLLTSHFWHPHRFSHHFVSHIIRLVQTLMIWSPYMIFVPLFYYSVKAPPSAFTVSIIQQPSVETVWFLVRYQIVNFIGTCGHSESPFTGHRIQGWQIQAHYQIPYSVLILFSLATIFFVCAAVIVPGTSRLSSLIKSRSVLVSICCV